MRYIRTKNKIYDLNNKYSQTPEEVQIALMTCNYKSADTIEELCDYFLIDKNDIEEYEPTTLIIFDDYDDFRYSMMCKDNASGYGCIKTSKGLIYVAKMDSEGNLCLI